jgi:hypothetical protein
MKEGILEINFDAQFSLNNYICNKLTSRIKIIILIGLQLSQISAK